ncbi:MAG: glycoside hydrolase family 2 TIM barrel-domain containing protein [Pseudomonadota bacterium]
MPQIIVKTVISILLISLLGSFAGSIRNAGAAPTFLPDIRGQHRPSADSPEDAGAFVPAPNLAHTSVEIRTDAGRYRLYRGGEPYFIKGVGGTQALASARVLGANSLRTWGAQNGAAVLEKADALGMSVLLGIWLSHRASDYRDPAYMARKTAEVTALAAQYRNHSALLMWALGNEINLQGADIPEAWHFVDTLARLIKRLDPGHPVISVIAFTPETLDRIARFAPSLDAVGVNAYGALPKLRAAMEASAYSGPYLVTEWGVTGHWEAERTDWDRPIEPPSTAKASMIRRYYVQDILANSDRCIGSYVFLWGQKQERTPTWYSLLIENLPGFEGQHLFSPAVDVMSYNWSGTWPDNRAPEVSQLSINGFHAKDGVALGPETQIIAVVTARDPESAPLTYVWEILAEPTAVGFGGAPESRPPTVGRVRYSSAPELKLSVPDQAGAYRLFVYAVDDKNHVGTANIPFRVVDLQAANPPVAAF